MSKPKNAIKKDAIKYLLGVVAMLTALIAMWGCTEEKRGIIPPEGFSLFEEKDYLKMRDGGFNGTKQRSLVFQDDGTPLQSVLDKADFTEDAKEYQWIAHITIYEPLSEYHNNGITQFLMKKPETPFYIGIRAGQLGNDAKLVILYDDNVKIVTQALTDNAYSSTATIMPTEAAWGRESLDFGIWKNGDLPDHGLHLRLEVYLGANADNFNWVSDHNHLTGSFFNKLPLNHIEFNLRQSLSVMGEKSLSVSISGRAIHTNSDHIVSNGITFYPHDDFGKTYNLYPYDTEMLLLEYSRITD